MVLILYGSVWRILFLRETESVDFPTATFISKGRGLGCFKVLLALCFFCRGKIIMKRPFSFFEANFYLDIFSFCMGKAKGFYGNNYIRACVVLWLGNIRIQMINISPYSFCLSSLLLSFHLPLSHTPLMALN